MCPGMHVCAASSVLDVVAVDYHLGMIICDMFPPVLQLNVML